MENATSVCKGLFVKVLVHLVFLFSFNTSVFKNLNTDVTSANAMSSIKKKKQNHIISATNLLFFYFYPCYNIF
jgi:hypothetical protein